MAEGKQAESKQTVSVTIAIVVDGEAKVFAVDAAVEPPADVFDVAGAVLDGLETTAQRWAREAGQASRGSY